MFSNGKWGNICAENVKVKRNVHLYDSTHRDIDSPRERHKTPTCCALIIVSIWRWHRITEPPSQTHIYDLAIFLFASSSLEWNIFIHNKIVIHEYVEQIEELMHINRFKNKMMRTKDEKEEALNADDDEKNQTTICRCEWTNVNCNRFRFIGSNPSYRTDKQQTSIKKQFDTFNRNTERKIWQMSQEHTIDQLVINMVFVKMFIRNTNKDDENCNRLFSSVRSFAFWFSPHILNYRAHSADTFQSREIQTSWVASRFFTSILE